MPWLDIRVKAEISKNRHDQAPCQLGHSPGAGTGRNPAVHEGIGGSWGEDQGALRVLELQAGTLWLTVQECV